MTLVWLWSGNRYDPKLYAGCAFAIGTFPSVAIPAPAGVGALPVPYAASRGAGWLPALPGFVRGAGAVPAAPAAVQASGTIPGVVRSAAGGLGTMPAAPRSTPGGARS